MTSVTGGDGITITGTAEAPVVNVAYGTGATTAVRGDDDRLTPAGAMTAYLGATAPAGWVMANGATASRTSCAGLFAVIGTTYGAGDGSTTFGLPNLNDRRFPMGRSAAEPLGSTGGSFNHTHTVADHTHDVGHTHFMGHTHYIDHVHSMQNHTHGVASHAHGISIESGNGGTTYLQRCALSSTGANCGAHTHGVNGQTFDNAPGTGGPSTPNTGTSSLPTSGGSSINDTGGASTGNTGAGGAQTSGASNPPYFAVNYIIKC